MATGGGGSGGKSAGDVRAGGAFVEILADDSKLRKALESTKRGFEKWGGTISKIGFASLAGDVAQISFFADALKNAATSAVDLKMLARATGSTTEEIGKLAFAFSTVGISAETFAQIMQDVQRRILDGWQGSDEAFQRLGLNVRELMKMSPQKQLEAIGNAFSKIPDGVEKNAAAFDLFGNNAQRVMRLIAQGPGKFAEALAKGGRAGAALTEEQAAAAEKLEEVWHTTIASLKTGLLEIGRALLGEGEEIGNLAGKVQEFVFGLAKWIRENKDLVIHMALSTAMFIAADVAVIALGMSIVGLGYVVGGLSTALGVLGAIVGFVFSPIGFAVIGIGVGLVFLVRWVERATGAFSQLGGIIGGGLAGSLETFQRSWGAVVDKLKAGDLEGAFAIAMAALSYEWTKFESFLTTGWIGFKEFFVDGWHEIGFTISEIWNDVTHGIVSAWNTIGGALSESWNDVTLGLVTAFHEIGYAISEIWNDVTHGIVSGILWAMQTAVEIATFAIRKLAGVGASLLQRVGMKEKAAQLRGLEHVGEGLFDGAKQTLDAEHAKEKQRIDTGRDEDKRADFAGHAQEKQRIDGGKGEAEAEHAQEQQRIDTARGNLQRENDAARAAQQAKADKAVAEAKAELDRLLAKPEAAGGLEQLPMPREADKKSAELSRLPDKVKGAFQSGNFAGQFALGDTIGKQALVAQQATAENTVQIKEILQAMPFAHFK